MVGNGSRKFVKVKFKTDWNGSKSHGSKSKLCQISSDGNWKLNGKLKTEIAKHRRIQLFNSSNWQVRQESVPSWYHRWITGVFVGASPVIIPGTPCLLISKLKRRKPTLDAKRKVHGGKLHKWQRRTCCFFETIAETQRPSLQFKNHFTLFLGVFTHTHNTVAAPDFFLQNQNVLGRKHKNSHVANPTTYQGLEIIDFIAPRDVAIPLGVYAPVPEQRGNLEGSAPNCSVISMGARKAMTTSSTTHFIAQFLEGQKNADKC